MTEKTSALKLKAKSGGGDYEQPEPGNHPAVLVAIIDLGTVRKEYKGKSYDAHEVYLCWELVGQQMTGSTNNHVIGRAFTASMGTTANLRNMVSTWRGKPIEDGEEFDLATLLSKPCVLDVQQTKDEKYTRLESECCTRWGTGITKGQTCPPAKRKPVVWEIDDNDQLPEHLDWLPFLYGESIQDRIARSDEWKAKIGMLPRVKKADEMPVDELADEPQDSDPF